MDRKRLDQVLALSRRVENARALEAAAVTELAKARAAREEAESQLDAVMDFTDFEPDVSSVPNETTGMGGWQVPIDHQLAPVILDRKTGLTKRSAILLFLKSVYPRAASHAEVAAAVSSTNTESTRQALIELETNGYVEKPARAHWKYKPGVVEQQLRELELKSKKQ